MPLKELKNWGPSALPTFAQIIKSSTPMGRGLFYQYCLLKAIHSLNVYGVSNSLLYNRNRTNKQKYKITTCSVNGIGGTIS